MKNCVYPQEKVLPPLAVGDYTQKYNSAHKCTQVGVILPLKIQYSTWHENLFARICIVLTTEKATKYQYGIILRIIDNIV